MDDPRVDGRCTDPLAQGVLMGLCAGLCRAQTSTAVAAFGESKRAWLASFLRLERGIPSHDTLRRVVSLLPADVFERGCRRIFRWNGGRCVRLMGRRWAQQAYARGIG
jgi:hypothetical protein